MTIHTGLILLRANIDIPKMAFVANSLRRSIRLGGHLVMADVPMTIDTHHIFFKVHSVAHDNDFGCSGQAIEHRFMAVETILTDASSTIRQIGWQNSVSILSEHIYTGW